MIGLVTVGSTPSCWLQATPWLLWPLVSFFTLGAGIVLAQALFVLAVVALKRLWVGRLKPGTYSIQSAESQRLRALTSLLDMPLGRGFVNQFSRTPVLNVVLTLLGARVEEGAAISRPSALVLAGADQLVLGRDCVVEDGAAVLGVLWQGNSLLIDETKLGDRWESRACCRAYLRVADVLKMLTCCLHVCDRVHLSMLLCCPAYL